MIVTPLFMKAQGDPSLYVKLHKHVTNSWQSIREGRMYVL